MDIQFTWILFSCRQFRLLTWTSFINQFVHSVGGGNEVKWVDARIFILASYKFHFINVHDNLV